MQIRLAMLARNCRNRVRNPPDSRTHCLFSVQRVRTSQIKRAPLGASGPAGPQCFSTNSAGSQTQCLALGAWAEQTDRALGAQTVSTTQIRVRSCVGERTQNCRKAALQLGVSFWFSCLRAVAASACEYGDSGASGKDSTQLRAKHQNSAECGTRVTSNIVDSLPERCIKAQESAGAEPPCRRKPTLGSRRSRTVRGACSYRPPSGHPAWPSATYRAARKCF